MKRASPSRAPRRLWLHVALLALAAILAHVPTPVGAQTSSYRVDVTASARRVELGDSLELTLLVEIDGPRPSSHETPRLDAPPSFRVVGPSTSFSSRRTVIQGRADERSTLRAVFRLFPSEVGRFTVPSPTIRMGNRTLSGVSVEIEVVEPAGGATADEPELDTPSDGRELAMATGPSDPVFLRAIADREQAVVGEQVTVSYYLYFREAYEMTERTEPQVGDFLRYALLTDPGSTTSTRTRVGGRLYGARLIDQVALIPLRTGRLSTGKLSARFNGRRIGARVLVASNEPFIDVSEPPEAGRPTDYRVGDVGRFTLRTTVQPRQIPQGGTVAVQVRVEGDGNLPSRLRMPDVPGGEWLEPSVNQRIAPRFGRVGGQRSFDYLLRLRQSGTIDLGVLALPSWDPGARSYVVAEAPLGSIDVEPKAPSPAEIARAAEGPGSGGPVNLPRPRAELGAAAVGVPLRLPLPWLALALALPPALVGLGLGAGRLRALRASRRDASRDLLEARDALSELRKLERSGDPKDLAAGQLRALHAALAAKLGRPTRGLTQRDLASLLAAEGLDEQLAGEIVQLVDACESARYAPEGVSADAHAHRERLQRAIARLGR